jgi:glucose/arabinose dehydrogenase
MTKARSVRALVCAAAVFPLAVGVQACGSSGKSSSTAASTASTASTATAAQHGPPAPKAASGAQVQAIARGIPTPTSIAVGGGSVFVGAGGSEEAPKQKGGVFAVLGGQVRRVPHSPAVVFGLTYHDEALYVASGPDILRWSGWNGTSFADSKVLYRGPKGFDGFNGLAFGPDGRIYAGVSLNEKDDHKQATGPYGQSVISLSADGRDLKVVAKGLRQPFQLTFVDGAKQPIVSVLGQDNLGKSEPPDYIVAASSGQNYGFPTCNWSKPGACAKFAKPLKLLPSHSSPMGIGAVGDTLYIALFGGTAGKPEVVSMPAAGGALTPFLTGFAAPVVALGVNAGSVYVGDLTGTVYKVSA